MTMTESRVEQRMGPIKDIPFTPLWWRVAIEALPPKEQSDGGIILPEEAQKAERTLSCIGRIIKTGDLACEATTNAQLYLGDDRAGRNLKPGTFVSYGQYSGQKHKLVDGREILTMAETDLLGVVHDPDQFVSYV